MIRKKYTYIYTYVHYAYRRIYIRVCREYVFNYISLMTDTLHTNCARRGASRQPNAVDSPTSPSARRLGLKVLGYPQRLKPPFDAPLALTGDRWVDIVPKHTSGGPGGKGKTSSISARQFDVLVIFRKWQFRSRNSTLLRCVMLYKV